MIGARDSRQRPSAQAGRTIGAFSNRKPSWPISRRYPEITASTARRTTTAGMTKPLGSSRFMTHFPSSRLASQYGRRVTVLPSSTYSSSNARIARATTWDRFSPKRWQARSKAARSASDSRNEMTCLLMALNLHSQSKHEVKDVIRGVTELTRLGVFYVRSPEGRRHVLRSRVWV